MANCTRHTSNRRQFGFFARWLAVYMGLLALRREFARNSVGRWEIARFRVFPHWFIIPKCKCLIIGASVMLLVFIVIFIHHSTKQHSNRIAEKNKNGAVRFNCFIFALQHLSPAVAVIIFGDIAVFVSRFYTRFKSVFSRITLAHKIIRSFAIYKSIEQITNATILPSAYDTW